MAEHARPEATAEPAAAPAAAVRPILGPAAAGSPPGLLALQRTIGNRAVGRVLARQQATAPVDTRAGTLIQSIVISLDTGRVAFLTNQGAAIRGTVDTDLEPGVYTVRPDPKKGRLWTFEPGQVKQGLRFHVALDGALPETLAYPESLPVIAMHGVAPEGEHSQERLKSLVVDLIDGQSWQEAFELLASLNQTDLLDLLAALQEDTGAVMTLLTHFDVAIKNGIEADRLLVALESVEWSAEKLYVDNFAGFFVDKESFGSPDPERVKAGKWNLKIIFTYRLTPERAIVVYADDIADSAAKSTAKPHYGLGGLMYPDRLTKGTVPRMWDAKQQVIKQVEAQNFEFIWTAWQATETVLGLVQVGAGLLTATIPAASTGRMPAGGGLRRPVTEAYEMQPGRWLDDFEGGTNMSDAARAYQARVCHADEAKGYYVKGVQFDGYDGGKLADAKHYPTGAKMDRALAQNNPFVGEKLLAQARRQLRAAGGTPVEWRVSSETSAAKIRQLFQANDIPIEVMFIP